MAQKLSVVADDDQPTTPWSEREWVTMSPRGQRFAGKQHYATFGYASVSVPTLPGYEGATRATWATDGENGLRLRVGDTGELVLTYRTFHRRLVSTGSIQKILNRPLRGQYPVASIEGPYLYIDLGIDPIDLAAD